MIAGYAYNKSIKTTNLAELRDGQPYTWGQVLNVIDVGDYTVVQYRCDFGSQEGKELFAGYLAGVSTSHSFNTLEEALVHSIAQNYDGINTQAAHYFMKMIGAPTDK